MKKIDIWLIASFFSFLVIDLDDIGLFWFLLVWANLICAILCKVVIIEKANGSK